jgi:hypothetical protein
LNRDRERLVHAPEHVPSLELLDVLAIFAAHDEHKAHARKQKLEHLLGELRAQQLLDPLHGPPGPHETKQQVMPYFLKHGVLLTQRVFPTYVDEFLIDSAHGFW